MPKVRIMATCEVHYCQVVNMTDEQFSEYESACDRNEPDRWFNNFAERWINTDDVCDAGDFEDVEATIIKDGE